MTFEDMRREDHIHDANLERAHHKRMRDPDYRFSTMTHDDLFDVISDEAIGAADVLDALMAHFSAPCDDTAKRITIALEHALWERAEELAGDYIE